MNGKQLIIGLWVVFAWAVSAPSLAMAQGAHSHHEVPSGGETEKLFQATLSVPDEIRPGKSFPIHIHIQDDTGRSVAVFDVFQEKLMHLILVSNDLDFFQHLHPAYKENGDFLIETMLPTAGDYTLFSDYKPAGHREQVSALRLYVQGPQKTSEAADRKKTEKILEDTKVRLSFSPKRVKANEESIVRFTLRQVSDDGPVKGLQPYLGEKGHLVVIKKSEELAANNYIHAHAMKTEDESAIQFMVRFPDPGEYKLWCQFNSKGKILTADFWITIER